MNSFDLHSSAPRTWRLRAVARWALGMMLSLAGCHDTLLGPAAVRLAPEQPPARLLDSPPGGGASISVSDEAPLAGNERDLGHYPTPTVVAMAAYQDFAIAVLNGTSGTGRLGLAGRLSGFGCTHQGEAYLASFPDEGGYGLPFAGCRLAGSPTTVTSFSDTIMVDGLVRYGYSFDAACPYPDTACGSYSGSSGVSLSRLSAALNIGGDSVVGGTLRAWPGREYTLAASASPAQLGRYQTPILPTDGGWTFAPDSGPIESDACDNGSGRICTKTFRRSGRLSLVALVNGAHATSGFIRVEMPALALLLSDDSVTVGDTVVASTTVIGLDTTALSYYSVQIVAPATMPGGGAGRGTSQAGAAGLPPCIGTRPVPTHCYLVFAEPGTAIVEVGALLDRRGLSVYAQRRVAVAVATAERRVRLSVGQRTIVPTARYWKFDVETKRYTPNPTRPPDTSRTVVTVSVVDAAGKPVPRADVTLSLHARERSAGHEHAGGKPTGILQTLERQRLADPTINTGPTGVATLLFAAPEVSGPVQLQGTSANASPDTTTVEVKIPGLVSLQPGAHYQFTGAVAKRHTDNHYGTPAALAAFRQFADSVYAWLGEPLGINDISLEQGGLFDVGGESWELPHGFHRRGTHADIRTKFADDRVFSKQLKERMRALWKVTLHFGIPVNEDDHLHLNYYP